MGGETGPGGASASSLIRRRCGSDTPHGSGTYRSPSNDVGRFLTLRPAPTPGSLQVLEGGREGEKGDAVERSRRPQSLVLVRPSGTGARRMRKFWTFPTSTKVTRSLGALWGVWDARVWAPLRHSGTPAPRV